MGVIVIILIIVLAVSIYDASVYKNKAIEFEKTISIISNERTKDLENLSYREKEIEDLKISLKDGGMMVKETPIIKKVDIDFDSDERVILIFAVQKLISIGATIEDAERYIQLSKKMVRIFTEAGDAEYKESKRKDR